MKVTVKSPDQLVVEERPVLLAGALAAFCAGLVFVLWADRDEIDLVGAAALGFFAIAIALVLAFAVRWVRADFSKATGRIEIASRGLAGGRVDAYALAHFRGARREVSRDSDGDTERVVLVFSADAVADMDPARRRELERARARGWRRAPINEVPLTVYFSGLADAGAAADVINKWAGMH